MNSAKKSSNVLNETEDMPITKKKKEIAHAVINLDHSKQ